MRESILPKQPPIFNSYLSVGKWLYFGLSIFLFESWFFLSLFSDTYSGIWNLTSMFWLICFGFSFVHIFLVIMDGWSRFQNYKRVKDQFYEYGFDIRLAARYSGSKCQRRAAIVAASELGMKHEIINSYRKMGIKWYHFIPYFMLQDPLFFFKRSFWSRTFLEKPYSSRFKYNEIYLQQMQLKQGIAN
ncbi:hypothetical protein E0K83_16755 [Gramella sp. BOM4]|nr:hypothetical protein [Christiangramia bathymodioli]